MIRDVIHVSFSQPRMDDDTARRTSVAARSWERLNWAMMRLGQEDLPRVWSEEGRIYAFIKDLFDASTKIVTNAVVVMTNSDIIVRSDAVEVIMSAVEHTDAAYAHRRDFSGPLTEIPTDDRFSQGPKGAGSDMCVMKTEWWREHRDEFPDMIIGHEAWDPVFRHLVDLTNPGKQTELKDIIGHESHESWWADPNNINRLKGQAWNRNLACKWLSERGIDPAIHNLAPIPTEQ